MCIRDRGTGAETTWATPDADGWRIDHPLWHSTSVGYGDVVTAVQEGESFFVVGIARRGGWTTARVTFPDVMSGEDPIRQAKFTHNAICEPCGPRRWACAVPGPAVDVFEAGIVEAGGSVEWTVGPDTSVDDVDFA